MSKYQVQDSGDLRKYRTEIPNLIDDLGLDPYTVRLYLRLKRVAGDVGACWQSTETLASACCMSAGKVSEAKKALLDAGLIEIETEKNKSGGREKHCITIKNIWGRNFEAFTSSPYELASSPHELQDLPSSPHELASSPGELKKELFKKEPLRVKKEPIKNDSLAPLDFSKLSVSDYNRVPELKFFHEATGTWPPAGPKGGLLKKIVTVIQENKLTPEDLTAALSEWMAKGYRRDNLTWLEEWAPAVHRGETPWQTRGPGKLTAAPKEDAFGAAIRKFKEAQASGGSNETELAY